MPHRIEPAPSGRARCRGCKQKIDKGEQRLSAAVPNAFGGGESFLHYHLACAALRQPDAFLELVDGPAVAGTPPEPDTQPVSATVEADAPPDAGVGEASSVEPDESSKPGYSAEVLALLQQERAAAVLSREHRRLRRLVRAERASSGRARCRHCHELIAKGEVRLVLEIVDEGMSNPAGFIHVSCVLPYIGTSKYVGQLITPQTEDDSIDVEELLAPLDA